MTAETKPDNPANQKAINAMAVVLLICHFAARLKMAVTFSISGLLAAKWLSDKRFPYSKSTEVVLQICCSQMTAKIIKP
jgi:hypothetical protein